MPAFGVLVPWGTNATGGQDYQVKGIRASEAAARKLPRPVGSLLVEFREKPKAGQILTDRGYYGIGLVKEYLSNPPGAKASRKCGTPAKRAKRATRAKRAARNPAWQTPGLTDWEIIEMVLNDNCRNREGYGVTEAVRALKRLRAQSAGGGAARNPPGALLSRRVLKLYYVHAGDGREYVHTFSPGVSMTADGDTVIVLKRPDGKPLSQNF